jgi:hypothetical protein
MNIPDVIFENLVSVFWLKILKFFDADLWSAIEILSTLDLGSGMEKIGSGILDGKNWIQDPGENISDPQHCM